jgi:hypothetical protein
MDRTAKASLWNTLTGQLLHTFSGHNGSVTSVALSAAGDLLATGSGDHTAKVWNTHTGQLMDTFSGHTDFITAVSLSVDGRKLTTASRDGTVKLWSIPGRRLVATFLAHSDGEWTTWVPEGYFIGSPGMVERTLREFRRNESRYPEQFFPRDNPNPQKVAEALGGTRRPEPPAHTAGEHTVTPPREMLGVAGVANGDSER